MSEKLAIEFPAQGWRQFLIARKVMLEAFDRARQFSRSHEVETFHGGVAEAQLRKWLSSFLPKRYGVTSGYIVSPGLKSTQRNPHFDVIIYDQLESPVLWVEDSPDASPQGRSLAIPVEYVYCVIEVKASLSPKTSQDAVDHLKDLLPLLRGLDDIEEKYKVYLPSKFFCGVVFFDLRRENQFSDLALRNLVWGIELRGFSGGVVLRGEGHQKDLTGELSIGHWTTPQKSLMKQSKQSLIDYGGMSESVGSRDGHHFTTLFAWSEFHFSKFAFDIVARLNGTYQQGFLSSFHGIGASAGE